MDSKFYKIGKKYEVVSALQVDDYGRFYMITGDGFGTHRWAEDDIAANFSIINGTTGSPIRTVTRREIVPGTYGDVTIEAIPFAGREVTYKRLANAASLREAARIFNEIADALDEQKESE